MTQEPLLTVSVPRAYKSLQARTDEAISGWAAGQINAEIVALADLAREVEQMQGRAVERARSLGLSWAQIAALLGVTKQAAHKRYGVNVG